MLAGVLKLISMAAADIHMLAQDLLLGSTSACNALVVQRSTHALLRSVCAAAIKADLLGGTMLQEEGSPSHDLHALTHPPLAWVHCHYLHSISMPSANR